MPKSFFSLNKFGLRCNSNFVGTYLDLEKSHEVELSYKYLRFLSHGLTINLSGFGMIDNLVLVLN